MSPTYILQQGGFVLRYRYVPKLLGSFRNRWFSLLGMKIGSGTWVPQLTITWPHQVAIGKNCILERGIFFKYDGLWQRGPSIRIQDDVFIGTGCEFNIREGIDVGKGSLIASGCRFVDHDHGIDVGRPMRLQEGPQQAIMIGEDVWLGANVVVLKGVSIGTGAIVAAGAIVTKCILPNEIWAGVPAKKIGQRD
jgi:acetyltransferase-like isoleucine patch superfamily enzyme